MQNRVKSNKFAFVGNVVYYIPLSCCIFPRGSYIWLNAKLNFFEVSI